MSFSNDVKLKAQAALKPYLEGDYPANVKNPILLLNYLNQHAIIPRPNYNTISTAENIEHAISCKIGELEMIGSGNTNKIAKTRAAQLFLDFLLNTDNESTSNSVNGDASQSFYSLAPSSIPRSENANGDGVLDTIESYNFNSMENCISNRVSEQFIIHGDDSQQQIILEPQCDLEDTMVSQTSSNTSETEMLRTSPMAHEQPSFDNYFDPFFKQRPHGVNHTYIMETENITNNVQKSEPKPVNVTVEKSNSNVNSKNVFAILQKKSRKHLKLIPRFRIEEGESGFRCSVQLGSYYALGEGSNKKEAKTNAAINLLNQMSDLN